jgi:hypothetical protein
MKKLMIMSAVVLVSAFASQGAFTNAQAIDIADPAGYDWKYDYDNTSGRFEFTNPTLGSSGSVVYWNNSATLYETKDETFFGLAPYDKFNDLGFPLNIQLGVDKSLTTTGWTSSGSYVYPSNGTVNIGSTSSTSSALKFVASFENRTPSPWQVGINLSDSSSSGSIWQFQTRFLPTPETEFMDTSLTVGRISRSSTNIMFFDLPPYSVVDVNHSSTSTQVLFRGMWFKWQGNYGDFIPETFYNEGYDVGYNDGFIDGLDSAESNVSWRISSLMTVLFNGMGGILEIKIFDELTLGSIMLFPVALTIFFFVFKLIRGPKG